ncbi:DUF7344 domain-containing protein [Natronorarus salvus]|uniref:DUF7344 domain-containing protein n=1 Tax=Natronorarus salvus TaxID=3117733 RepID=UPI002F261D7F
MDGRNVVHAELSADTVYAILKPRRRRLVLSYFMTTSAETATTTELAEWIAEHERSPDPALPAPSLRTIEVTLTHTHFPVLDENGLIDFSFANDRVEYHACPDIEAHLELHC